MMTIIKFAALFCLVSFVLAETNMYDDYLISNGSLTNPTNKKTIDLKRTRFNEIVVSILSLLSIGKSG